MEIPNGTTNVADCQEQLLRSMDLDTAATIWSSAMQDGWHAAVGAHWPAGAPLPTPNSPIGASIGNLDCDPQWRNNLLPVAGSAWEQAILLRHTQGFSEEGLLPLDECLQAEELARQQAQNRLLFRH